MGKCFFLTKPSSGIVCFPLPLISLLSEIIFFLSVFFSSFFSSQFLAPPSPTSFFVRGIDSTFALPGAALRSIRVQCRKAFWIFLSERKGRILLVDSF